MGWAQEFFDASENVEPLILARQRWGYAQVLAAAVGEAAPAKLLLFKNPKASTNSAVLSAQATLEPIGSVDLGVGAGARTAGGKGRRNALAINWGGMARPEAGPCRSRGWQPMAVTVGHGPAGHPIRVCPPLFLAVPTARHADAMGRRTDMRDAWGHTHFEYDPRGRLTEKSSPAGTLHYTYDDSGRLLTAHSDSVGGVDNRYHYDAAGRLDEAIDQRTGGGTTLYSYDGAGNLDKVTYPNGQATAYTYNDLNRLTLMRTEKSAGLTRQYEYDLRADGIRRSLTESGPSISRVSAWDYDAFGRLVSETITASAISGAIGYDYDLVGNRLARHSSVSGILPQAFSYDTNDRLEDPANGNAYDYDDNGSTIASDGHSFTYDAEGKLLYRDKDTANEIRMVYDGDGNRVAKTVAGVTTTYLVDTNNPTGYSQVYEERVDLSLSKVYVYGHDLIAQDHIGATGYRYFGYDGLGSTRYLTDSNGVVTDNFEYEAFGGALGAATSTTTHLFAGEAFDTDIYRYFLRARYFDYSKGRFQAPDPLFGNTSEPVSLHKYLYGNLSPVNYTDPSGEMTASQIVFGCAVIGVLSTYVYIKYKESAGEQLTTGQISLYYLVGASGGLAIGYFAALPIATTLGWISVAGPNAVLWGAKGYNTFDAFKNAFGPAGPGQAWHHIVEQTPGNISRFGPQAIHNANNLIKLAHGAGQIHNRISGFYSSIRYDVTGSTSMTVRQWLASQSYEAQFEFGKRAIENYSKGIW